MAKGDNITFLSYTEALPGGGSNWTSDTITCALITGTVNHTTQSNWSDLSSQEVADASYSRQTVGGKSINKDTGNKRTQLLANNVVYANLANVTPTYMIYFKDTGTPATSTLIGSVEAGDAANGENYNFNWGAAGVLVLRDPNVP